jgi:hypothetical protein
LPTSTRQAHPKEPTCAAELTIGRTFVVHFDHGDDFYTALSDFCREQDVKQGFIPMFIAGMREVELVGTFEKLDNPDVLSGVPSTWRTWRRSEVGPWPMTTGARLCCRTFTYLLTSKLIPRSHTLAIC